MSDFNVGDKVYLECEVVKKDMCDNKYTLKYINWRGDEYISTDVTDDALHPTDEAYNKGLNDAWELAKKVVLQPGEGGYTASELVKIFCKFTYASVLDTFTPQEALAKVKAYEERNEIKKGDVVKDSVGEALVLRIDDNRMYLLCRDRSCGESSIFHYKKTGKHYDSIDEFMRSADD